MYLTMLSDFTHVLIIKIRQPTKINYFSKHK
jgi:hypothetical protein